MVHYFVELWRWVFEGGVWVLMLLSHPRRHWFREFVRFEVMEGYFEI